MVHDELCGSFLRKELGGALRIGPNIRQTTFLQNRPLRGLGFSTKIRYHPSPAATPSSRGRRLWLSDMYHW
jgi:hypothetical protein